MYVNKKIIFLNIIHSVQASPLKTSFSAHLQSNLMKKSKPVTPWFFVFVRFLSIYNIYLDKKIHCINVIYRTQVCLLRKWKRAMSLIFKPLYRKKNKPLISRFFDLVRFLYIYTTWLDKNIHFINIIHMINVLRKTHHISLCSFAAQTSNMGIFRKP